MRNRRSWRWCCRKYFPWPMLTLGLPNKNGFYPFPPERGRKTPLSASDGSDVAKDIPIAPAECIVHIFNDVAFISNDWSSRIISIISIFKQLTLDKSLFAKARANPSEYVLVLDVVGGCFGEWAPFSTQTRRRAARRTAHTFVSVSTAKTRLGGREGKRE